MLIEKTLPSNEKIKLLSSGKLFFDELVKLIAAAREEIHFQIYIFENDETGKLIADELFKAASRGVKIYLLIDAFGNNLSEDQQSRLKNAGVQLKLYGPIFKKGTFHIGRRLHRKVIVIDQNIAVVAGLNISNNYNDIDGRAWLDFAIVVTGPSVVKLYSVCLQRWLKKPLRRMPKKRKKFLDKSPGISSLIHVRQNDWIRGLNETASTYKKEIKNSRQSILIVGGYFLPGGRMRRTLRRARKRGVKISVILAAESDVPIQHLAQLYLYQWMIRNGINIYEYHPSNVHGKVLIADKRLVSIGSYDLNNLSTYSNIELNLNINDTSFAAAFYSELEKVIKEDCKHITEEELSRRSNFWRRFKQWVAYQAIKSLFFLGFWLARTDEEEYQ